MSKDQWWWFGSASGLLLGFSLTPLGTIGPGVLAWIAYVPLLYVLARSNWRDVARASIWVHLVGYLISGHWVLLHPMASAISASAAGLLALATLSAIPWMLAARLPSTQTGRRLVAAAAGTVAVDMFHLHVVVGFPWLLLGHTQAAFEPINQAADIGGVTGLSAFAITMNVFSFLIVTGGRRRRVSALAAAAVLFGVVSLYGVRRLDTATDAGDSLPVSVMVVQPSLNALRWADVESNERVDSLLELTAGRLRRAAGHEPAPHLIVWPETSLPPVESGLSSQDGGSTALSRVQAFVDSAGIPLLTGAIEILAGDLEERRTFANAAFLVEPGVATTRTYRKRRLVPFAEHVPYSTDFAWLRGFAASAGGVSGYVPGRETGLFDVGGLTIGTLICFESAVAQLVRDASGRGADAIVVITQDGWWGDSFGYRQHLRITRLRAIETRRPIIQVAATGVSANIHPSGRVDSRLDWMERGTAVWTVGGGNGTTIYGRIGDWPGWLCVIISAVLILPAFLIRHPPD